jgi:hypothetical protein
MTAHRIRNFSLSFSMFFLLFIYLLRRNKLNIVRDDFNQPLKIPQQITMPP